MSKKNRIAIFGYEKLAVDIADYLNNTRNELIIVDNNEESIREAAKQGFKTALTDYSRDQELREIGIGADIDTVFCLLPDDAENVFLVISVRSIDSRVPIVSIADAPDSIPKFLAAGADKVIDPYEISGLKIWRMLRKPIISQVMEKTLMSNLDLNLAGADRKRVVSRWPGAGRVKPAGPLQSRSAGHGGSCTGRRIHFSHPGPAPSAGCGGHPGCHWTLQ